jgi:hypothetical protein
VNEYTQLQALFQQSRKWQQEDQKFPACLSGRIDHLLCISQGSYTDYLGFKTSSATLAQKDDLIF